jgi:hypothetical protein
MSKMIAMVVVMGASAWFFLWGIPWLLKRFPQPAWRYPATTSPQRLHRHHRLAAWCVYACFFCIVGTVSSLVQFLVFGWQGWTLWMLFAYAAGMVLFAVPAILLGAWMGEVERECRVRGIAVPTMERFRDRVRSDAIGMFLWIAAAIAAPWILQLVSRK